MRENDLIRDTYDIIAHQVAREEALVNTRLGWSLQINGWLFAALGLLKFGEDDRLASVVWFLPIVGVIVSGAGLMGILAAQRQLLELTTTEWTKIEADCKRPRPFGDPVAHSRGVLASRIPAIILGVAWVAIFCVLVAHWVRHHDDKAPGAPTREAPTAASTT